MGIIEFFSVSVILIAVLYGLTHKRIITNFSFMQKFSQKTSLERMEKEEYQTNLLRNFDREQVRLTKWY